MVRVIHCCNEVHVQPGLTVGAVQKALKEVLNVSPDAIALVNGEQAPSARRLVEGDNLEFVTPDGEKGVGEVWTRDEFCTLFNLTEEQLEDQIAKGLKVMRLGDGTIRITETAVDEFLRGRQIESPYLSTDEAARYCNLTRDAFYGRVERRKIKPLPGSGKENRFTREQCDQMMKGE